MSDKLALFFREDLEGWFVEAEAQFGNRVSLLMIPGSGMCVIP